MGRATSTGGAPRPVVLLAAASTLAVVVPPFVLPAPASTLALAAGYLVLLICTAVLAGCRRRRAPAERQFWGLLGASMGVSAVGVVVFLAAYATGAPGSFVAAASVVTMVVAVALNHLSVVRWTRPSAQSSGIDPDHLLGSLCAIVVLVCGALVLQGLDPFSTDSVARPRLPQLVFLSGASVAAVIVLVTTRGALRRGDPRPAIIAVGLVLSTVGGAVVMALDLPSSPWLPLTRVPWPVAAALCALLPEVAHARERQDVAISSVFAYATAALALPVVALALRDDLPGVAAAAGLAAAGATARLLLDVRELRALITNRRSSVTDDLTGLPNRRGVTAVLERALAEGRPLVVAVLDLDRFKEVNDTLGHAAGDELLRTVAGRLRSTLLHGEVVARVGGDEFVVVAPAPSPHERAAHLGHDVLGLLEVPVHLDGVSVPVGASIGTATWTPSTAAVSRPLVPGEAAARLLRAADVAMYDAKRSGSGWVPHDPRHHHDPATQLALVADLRTALARRELVLHHQPQVCAATGRPRGVEALVRWPHPTLGLLPPSRFLDLAETHGLMGLLTDEVLRTGIAQQAAWRAAGLDVRLSLNLPASALHDLELPARVGALLAEHGVAACSVVLEVTESVLLKDPERSSAVVEALRASGLRVSIDDFGTGHSSLARLRNLSVDELKLDGSFTRDLLVDARASTIVAGSVQLAHALGMTVVAEGVEDVETLAHLVRLGCDEVQGYVFAAPMPADELDTWWRAATAATAVPQPR